MDELTYILKRILQMIPVLLIVTICIFFGIRAIPGDPALLLVGNHASEAAYQAMRAKLGLDEPLLMQYFRFLKQCLTFDFGDSLTMSGSVNDLISQKSVITISLTLMTMLFAVLISVPLGYISGVNSNKRSGRLIHSLSLVFISVPEFLIGILLMLVFSLKLHVFPVGGWGSTIGEHIHALILPSIAGCLTTAAIVMRNIRGSVVEVLRNDYVDFARSKGLPKRRIRSRYILRNVMIPAVTLIAMRGTSMLAGSVVIENVFALPGMGQLLLQGIISRDYPVVEGCVYLFAIIVLIMNLITDVSYSLLDPRVRLS